MWATHQHNIKNGSLSELFFDKKALVTLLDSNLNLFVHGPTGSGKKCMVSKYHDQYSGNWSFCEYESDGPQKQSMQLMTRTSTKHTELCLPDGVKNKRLAIRTLVCDLCSRFSVDADGKPCGSTIVFYDVHHLTRTIIKMLAAILSNRTECRFIFVSDKWSETFASVCIPYRFERQSIAYVADYVSRLCRHCDRVYDDDLLREIYTKQNGNVVQCIQLYDVRQSRIINVYEKVIKDICEEYFKQNPNFTLIRNSYYQLLVNNVTITMIISDILKELVLVCHTNVVPHLVHLASVFEYRAAVGEREIYHLDAFGVHVVQVISSK